MRSGPLRPVLWIQNETPKSSAVLKIIMILYDNNSTDLEIMSSSILLQDIDFARVFIVKHLWDGTVHRQNVSALKGRVVNDFIRLKPSALQGLAAALKSNT